MSFVETYSNWNLCKLLVECKNIWNILAMSYKVKYTLSFFPRFPSLSIFFPKKWKYISPKIFVHECLELLYSWQPNTRNNPNIHHHVDRYIVVFLVIGKLLSNKKMNKMLVNLSPLVNHKMIMLIEMSQIHKVM